MKQYTSVYSSKKDQAARTPSYLLELAHKLFVGDADIKLFDPCPAQWNPNSQWDALDGDQPWSEFNFVNPPFDQTAKFFERAIEQEDATTVFLVPPRFHTRYFHAALPHVRRIVLIDHRVRFVGYKTPLPTALCFLVFGPAHATYPIDDGMLNVQQLNIGFYVSKTPLSITQARPQDTTVLHGTLSNPLSEIVSRNEPASVLCASRLDNRVLMNALTRANSYTVFLAPTLHYESTKQKYLEGSLLLSLHGSNSYEHFKDHTTFAAHVVKCQTHEHSDTKYQELLQLPDEFWV